MCFLTRGCPLYWVPTPPLSLRALGLVPLGSCPVRAPQVAVALMFSSTPLFQAWYEHRPVPCAKFVVHPALRPLFVEFPCMRPPSPIACAAYSLSVGIIFVSYALQVRFTPYASSDSTNDLDAAVLTPGMRLAYVSVN